MLLLAFLGCFSPDTGGIPVLTGIVPPAAAASGAPDPAGRIGDCTAIPFPGIKVDYQCGAVKAAYLELRGFEDPLLGAASIRAQFGPGSGPARMVDVDGVAVEVRPYPAGDAAATPTWAAFSVAGGRVREAFCMPVAASDSAEADCTRLISTLVVYGAVEPRAPGVPPFAGRAMTAPAGCTAHTEPGWAGVVTCPDGSELRWSSSPLVKDLDAHFSTYDNPAFLGTGAQAAPLACTIDGAEGACRIHSGAVNLGTAAWNAIVGYATVRDGGVTVACMWGGAPTIPAACASVLAARP